MTNETMTNDRPDQPRPAPPIPVPDESSAEFWERTADGVFATQQCVSCGWRSYPPRMVCPMCLADPPSFRWSDVSGEGHLATWTIVRDALLPGFADATPYVVAEVELVEQEGLRVVARLLGVADDELTIGMPLSVSFVDGGEGMQIPVFERSRS